MRTSRKVTVGLAVLCCMSLIAAFIVGISGNPPGISLCCISAGNLILAFVHTWRKTWKFLVLLVASLIGFAVFTVLHNVFYGLAELTSEFVVLSHSLKFLHAVSFLVAIFVCPVGLLVGTVGGMVMAVAHFKKRRVSGEAA
jgi:hypothetical protein